MEWIYIFTASSGRKWLVKEFRLNMEGLFDTLLSSRLGGRGGFNCSCRNKNVYISKVIVARETQRDTQREKGRVRNR